MINEYDNNFYEVLYDSDGNEVMVLKDTIVKKSKESDSYFDNSHGHCPFCGQLSCNGQCFK